MKDFFFNDTATTKIYTLSLHDALPISGRLTAKCLAGGCHGRLARPCMALAALERPRIHAGQVRISRQFRQVDGPPADRKSTRLNSSHANNSYVVFCLKKQKIYHSFVIL